MTGASRPFPCMPSLGEHCGNCHRCTDFSHKPEGVDRWSCADGTCAKPHEHERPIPREEVPW